MEGLQLLLNRGMRTRMYDGVGAAVSNGDGYPILSDMRKKSVPIIFDFECICDERIEFLSVACG